jgi:cellulose 1,4-beta-cellobiosidase
MPAMLVPLLTSTIVAQLRGDQTPNHVLSMPIKKCTVSAGCTVEDTAITLDANWRWMHKVPCEGFCPPTQSGKQMWHSSICHYSEGTGFVSPCGYEGVGTEDYDLTYGVSTDTTTDEASARFRLFTHRTKYFINNSTSSRVLMLSENRSRYHQFELLNREVLFTVDTSNVPCGVNGALYFVAMDPTGKAGQPLGASMPNDCGAEYGTDYCDSTCPKNVPPRSGRTATTGSPSSAHAAHMSWCARCTD